MVLAVSFALLVYAAIATVFTVETGKHPRGLYVLFGTEMWERFSYYGMRALLVLYLVEHHGWQPEHSSSVYKWYTSLVYLTPLLGGLIADRYLGLRASIITGGVLMAIGHFLMAFEPLPMFYLALAFLIAGNGFFKPNISTLVGKMYKKEDTRRDAAFTIFYMGINVGAGLSPIWCGELRTHFGFHWGFGAAGVGMVIGLVTFLLGQRTVLSAVKAAGNDLKTLREIDAEKKLVPDNAPRLESAQDAADQADDDKPGETGIAGVLSRTFPLFLMGIALLLPAYYAYLWKTGAAKWTDMIMPLAYGAVFMTMGFVLRTIRGAAKDKSVVIFILFFFVVLFWMAFEQAGNALNLWAEFHTRLTAGGISYTAESFQSINPVFILLFAPVFSILWVWLGKKGIEPRTPYKMLIALVLVALSFGVMVVGAAQEQQQVSVVPLAGNVFEDHRPGVHFVIDAAPDGSDSRVSVCDDEKKTCEAVDAHRLVVNPAQKTLTVSGVLPHYVVAELLKTASPGSYVKDVASLEKKTQDASLANVVTYEVKVDEFVWPLDAETEGKAGVHFDPSKRVITFAKAMDAPTRIALEGAAAPKEFRTAIESLEKKSQDGRVGAIWLLLSYLFATLGELCLSPVGLSMVTKLAPRRFGSLFMGVWLLSSSVAQYAGGSIGESWGKITPVAYFTLFVVSSLVGAVLLGVLSVPAKRLMREVH